MQQKVIAIESSPFVARVESMHASDRASHGYRCSRSTAAGGHVGARWRLSGLRRRIGGASSGQAVATRPAALEERTLGFGAKALSTNVRGATRTEERKRGDFA